MPPRDFRLLLDRAVPEPARRAIWRAVFGGKDANARREYDKYMTGERGETLWNLIDEALKYADKRMLREWCDSICAPPDPGEQLAKIGEQLDLLTWRLEEAKAVLKEREQVISLDAWKKKSG